MSAQTYAQSGRFPEMLVTCQHIIDASSNKVDVLLEVGALLLNFGFLSRARECFERICKHAPDDLRAVVNLASLAHVAGDHAESRRLYEKLQEYIPNHPVIRRNVLLSMNMIQQCQMLIG